MELKRIIPPGVGLRLKEERLRLGYSQTQLAEHAGIKRLTQAQYENEATRLPVSYLSKVIEAGVDIDYVLFGARGDSRPLSEHDESQIERLAFLLIEDVVAARPDDSLSPEDKHLLFQGIRNRLRRHLLPEVQAEESSRAKSSPR